MSQQDITGKTRADLASPGKVLVLYRLSDTWLAHCQAIKVPFADVQELAAQGAVVGAYLRLSERLAGTGTGATAAALPPGVPFVRVAPVATSAPVAGLLQAALLAAVVSSSQSAPSGAPKAGLEAAAVAFAQRALPVFQAGKSRRFRPLVRSRLLLVASVSVPRTSMQIFVLNQALGGTSNGCA
ncbi:hypothetical protein [Comamonas sp. E6]|uniref:hypothetical protein n=1 Tax=Comamonas sp. E6 TaxID=364029 RepID=UPI00128E6F89|nr:hypothetical protein [Comamonas sp. E6]